MHPPPDRLISIEVRTVIWQVHQTQVYTRRPDILPHRLATTELAEGAPERCPKWRSAARHALVSVVSGTPTTLLNCCSPPTPSTPPRRSPNKPLNSSWPSRHSASCWSPPKPALVKMGGRLSPQHPLAPQFSVREVDRTKQWLEQPDASSSTHTVCWHPMSASWTNPSRPNCSSTASPRVVSSILRPAQVSPDRQLFRITLEGRANQARRDDDRSTKVPSHFVRAQVRQPLRSVPVGDRVPHLAVYCGG